MIERVVALTIEKAVHRQWMYVGGMIGKGVPFDDIWFHRGRTGSEFGNDYDRIAAAADADDFKFVGYFQGHGDTGIIKQAPAQMCQVWSYASILRDIYESKKTTLVTWDDRILTVPYYLLQDIICSLEEQDDGFWMFQLRLRGEPEYLRMPKEKAEEACSLHTEQFSAFTNPSYVPNYTQMFTRKGFFGYDETVVFTPGAAGWMLEQMYAIEDIDPDIKKMAYMDIPFKQKKIYCPTINIDNWVCWGLREATDKAIKDGKGIYCPRYPGYDFIDDPIPMGSFTDWATKKLPHYDSLTARAKLQYIN